MEKRNGNSIKTLFLEHVNSSAVIEEFMAVAPHRVGLGLKDQGCPRVPSERTAGDSSGPAKKGCAHMGQGRHNRQQQKGSNNGTWRVWIGQKCLFFQSHFILGNRIVDNKVYPLKYSHYKK